MKETVKKLLGFFLSGLLLASCNLPTTSSGSPTREADMLRTAAAQTAVAQMTVGVVIPSPGPTLAASTAEPGQPTQTVSPENSAATQSSSSENEDSDTPCDQAEFVSDVTVPDGTVFFPNEDFTKTWRLKNAGTCTWTTSYSLIFDHEKLMDGPTEIFLPHSVAPGETIDLSVNLKSPKTPGTYRSYWILRNASNVTFGVGSSGEEPFFVDIEVSNPLFAVTGVYVSVSPENFQGPCNPATLNLSANIVASRDGRVTYYWVFSDGTTSDTKSIDFDNAGTKTISYSLQLTKDAGSYSGWVAVYIDEPNHQKFTQVNYSLTCQ